MMTKKRVVLTGTCGHVAQRMFDALSERYELVCLDVKDTDKDGTLVPNVAIVDLTGADRDAYRQYFAGADAVLHCAFVPTSRPADDTGSAHPASSKESRPAGFRPGGLPDNSDARFRAEQLNVAMAYNIYKVSQEENVRRVVIAGSNHAADYYEELIWADKIDMVTPDMRLSNNFYGWAKASYELLGFVFACGMVEGTKLEVVHWRIGGPRETDIDHVAPGDMKSMHRALGAYLSVSDQVQQAVRMIETENIEDENGIPFLVVHGISGNSHRFWSLTNAFDKINYAPEDNSQLQFARQIAKLCGVKVE